MSKSILVAAAAKPVATFLDDLYNVAKGSLKTKIAKWRNTNRISRLYRELNSVRMVKTIYHTEDAINLFDFYCPSSVLVQNERRTINKIDDLPGKARRYVIEGTVGQGKSIFLRFLCATEMFNGSKIPIFVELRYLDEKETVLSQILRVLKELGFDSDEEVFELMADSGKLVLCLDGFDELKDSSKANVIKQIENLAARFELLQLLVTSRPDNGIDKSARFMVLKMAPLRNPEVRAIVDKLQNDAAFTENLMKAVIKSESAIANVLTTPLMVTLLVLAYKAERTIPKTIAEFYESLFNTLLWRHDKLKPAYDRKRTSGLSDREIRDVFDGFCFLARQKEETALTLVDAERIAEKAAKLSQVNCIGGKFVSDIKRVTCLILEEAGLCHFIHKSVAEYHSASFIKSRPEDFAEKFYDRLRKSKYIAWEQDLRFLEQIDRYRYNRYFLLRDAEEFALRESMNGRSSEMWYKYFFENCLTRIRRMTLQFEGQHSLNGLYYGSNGLSEPRLISLSQSDLANSIMFLSKKGWKEEWYKPVAPSEQVEGRNFTYVKVSDLLDYGTAALRNQLMEMCKEQAKNLSSLVVGAQEFNAMKEKAESELFEDLL